MGLVLGVPAISFKPVPVPVPALSFKILGPIVGKAVQALCKALRCMPASQSFNSFMYLNTNLLKKFN